MKQIFFAAATVFLLAATACNSSSSDTAQTDAAQEAAAQTGKEYTADTTASVVNWRATHKGGMAPRYGTLKVTDGILSADNGQVTGGSFTVDINSLWVDPASVTEKDKKPEQLAGHLKSQDFFNAETYPTAKFTITNVAPYDSSKQKSELEGANSLVSGNLTMKDSTINITFPAKITVNNDHVEVASQFMVDRTSWGLRYGAEGDAADWLISKDFQVGLDVKATAK